MSESELSLWRISAMRLRQQLQLRARRSAGGQGGAPQEEVTAAVNELKRLKIEPAAAAEAAAGSDNAMSAEDRALDDMLLRRMFVVPAFEIHGGVAGLYDFGPPGCSLKDNVLNAWKRTLCCKKTCYLLTAPT